ncbi:4-hydroxythreonine-4-phosphate dehydrogenase PdxA [Frigidibacter sp. ROC022]|uniref:4-hydroxythreonine-4-phosphate dehydrogenase PdxA n=1 Tax=Frigidibacter sp. ROC022 TaxID=2971796 RepID=UPI00215A5EB4|nr:4-hydroxythreonine-4-phosphate dehydrogenase PdxA [Frigidibacter sp. ROC022]MCR8726353.1 4-hydroxythreonine-4-phosphate dehydrogenase PdxA [Frigidibacter sp. ROC022]
MSVPPLALTCGEPAGVGPEIAVKARAELGRALPFFVIGDPGHFPQGSVQEIAAPSEAATVPAGRLPLLRHDFPKPAVPGRPAPENAAEVISVIARAVALVQAGEAGAVVTNPINKAALKSGAGFAFPGHTEFLADLAGVDRVVMMLASDALKVVPVTIHVAISEVPRLLTVELLEETLRITDAALRKDFGLATPRIAVAGLNPHAGESGTMGCEDRDLIAPVIARLQAEGMALSGPHPADTMFHARARAGYDAAVCMYHDQALIPIKTLAFDEGVNVTLGLPFIRTSPDHGTAFDIAGTGAARADSLIAALRMAARMAARRHGVAHAD